MGSVYNMQENVSFSYFIKRTLKTFYEVMRQFSDKPYCITQQERCVFINHFSCRGIKRSEEFVLCKNFTLAQQVHYRGFSNIGISYQRDANKFTSFFSLRERLLIYSLQSFSKQ